VNARLDAVSKSKQAYVIAKTTLEQRLREQMREELANLQTQIDIAVRFAVDAGEKKSDILRALGTKDYNTLKASLERTQAVSEIVGVNPLDSVYRYNGGTLTVVYNNHGPQEISGYAEFTVKTMDDKSVWFMAVTPLWDDAYAVRNDVVAAFDGKQHGFYYEEALGWIRGQL
jgi:hypothetical protein